MSPQSYVEKGILYIRDAQIDDSGVYVCQAQVSGEIVRQNVTLTVGGKIYCDN